MKTFTAWALAAILALESALLPGNTAAVADNVVPSDPHPIVISSDNLEDLLFSGDTDIVRVQQSVLKARDELGVARGNLLPSISAGVIVSALTSPMFVLTAVSCLVPFLFPSNWFDLKASAKNYDASVVGVHISKLNVYAIAYALIDRIGADEAVLGLLQEHNGRLVEYVDGLRIQEQLGLVSKRDLLTAELELAKSEVEVSKSRQAIMEEYAAIRRMFGFPLDRDFRLSFAEMSESALESSTPEEALETVASIAPESEQLELLIQLARAKYHSSIFAFLGGCSGSQGTIYSGSTSSVFNLSTGASVSLGFATYPQIKLSKRSVDDLELRRLELKLELGETLEKTLAGIHETKFRHEQAAKSLEIAETLLGEQQFLAGLGRSTVRAMLDAMAAVSEAKIDVLVFGRELSAERVTLKRMGLEDRFASILAKSRADYERKKKKKSRSSNDI